MTIHAAGRLPKARSVRRHVSDNTIHVASSDTAAIAPLIHWPPRKLNVPPQIAMSESR